MATADIIIDVYRRRERRAARGANRPATNSPVSTPTRRACSSTTRPGASRSAARRTCGDGRGRHAARPARGPPASVKGQADQYGRASPPHRRRDGRAPHLSFLVVPAMRGKQPRAGGSISGRYNAGFLNVDRPGRAQPSLYLRRPGGGHPLCRSADHRPDADRHLPQHRHSGRHRRLELQRPVGRRDGQPHRLRLRARADHDGQRHRAHRVAVAARPVGRQGVLPARRQDRARPSRRSRRSGNPRSARMPPGTQPPFIITYNASSGADPAARLSGNGLSEQQLYDLGGQLPARRSSRPSRARRSRTPYGGKQAQIQVDLDPRRAAGQGARRRTTWSTRSRRRT